MNPSMSSDRLRSPRTSFDRYLQADLAHYSTETQGPILVNGVTGISYVSRALDYAPQDAVCCRINGQLSNLDTLLTQDSTVEFYTSDTIDGRMAVCNTRCIVLNVALQQSSQTVLDYGVTEDGYYCVFSPRDEKRPTLEELRGTVNYLIDSNNLVLLHQPLDSAKRIMDASWHIKKKMIEKYNSDDTVCLFKMGSTVGVNFTNLPITNTLEKIRSFQLLDMGQCDNGWFVRGA